MKWRISVLIVVYLSVTVSAIMVVFNRHEARKQFAELQKLEQECDVLGTEWGRLKLEQTTLLSHTRVEQLARKQLGMSMPERAQVDVIQER